jgi:hypothetical protein
MVPWFDITIVLAQATFRTGFEFTGGLSAGAESMHAGGYF